MTKTSSTNSQSETKFQTNAKTTRYFSEAFKREKIKEVLEKRIRVTNFSKLYCVSRKQFINDLGILTVYFSIGFYGKIYTGINGNAYIKSAWKDFPDYLFL